jgi:hypothetical protein
MRMSFLSLIDSYKMRSLRPVGSPPARPEKSAGLPDFFIAQRWHHKFLVLSEAFGAFRTINIYLLPTLDTSSSAAVNAMIAVQRSRVFIAGIAKAYNTTNYLVRSSKKSIIYAKILQL